MSGLQPLSNQEWPRSVIGLLWRDSKLLVVRRSQHVVAPGMVCFPGGMLKEGETEEQGLRREMREELGIEVEPLQRLWRSIAPWNVHLIWWQITCPGWHALTPNPREIDDCWWATMEELAATDQLLESNRHFLSALSAGEFSLRGGAI